MISFAATSNIISTSVDEVNQKSHKIIAHFTPNRSIGKVAVIRDVSTVFRVHMDQRTIGGREAGMRDAALLAVWLIGLFGLIGGVVIAVARFVRRDTARYDEQVTWAAYAPGNGDRHDGSAPGSEKGKSSES